MYTDPIAYFITWSCYGTRLHGDARGTVDRRHNVYNTPTIAPSSHLLARRTESLKHPLFLMNSPARSVVEDAIRSHCAFRKWELHTINVRTNHLHVIVSSSRYGPKTVMEQLKARATRLLRESDLFGHDAPAWTAHGSHPYIWDEEGLAEAINYVANRQGADLD